MENTDYHKTTIEILSEFAKLSGRKVVSTETPYPSSALHPVVRHRRTLYMPNNQEKTSYFVCFGDAKKFGDHAIYCGMFIPISISFTGLVELPISTTVNIRKRNILDKLNPFLPKNSFSTRNRDFDSKFVITGDKTAEIKRIFNNNEIQNLVMEALALEGGLNIAINELNPEFVPALNNKSHLCILRKREWLLESSLIENLFDIIERFRTAINKMEK